ncbi:ATP-binding cassette domain-containing protein [Ideonella livida]|uniref:ABC transporter ATP-binding protein n=1 Tax=Ideonella livida TaxID=2707176 RepID=A0A7C9TMX2_9BURK|nr:ABC transporter ATP-binding protein [Ideonella livida]NDY92965.1 ABC transporter ATP-binding protein [Ideonella livida]
MPGASILELQQFGLTAGERVLLSRVDLRVPARGVTVLTGPAGGGKSMLLRGMAVLSRDVGRMVHHGRAQFHGAPLQPRNRPFMAFPNPPGIRLSVEEFMRRCHRARQPSQILDLDLAWQTLAWHGCGDLVALKQAELADLSVAQFRRLGIGMAAVMGEPLVLLDDPTAGLPRAGAISVLSLMSQLAKDRAVLAVMRQIEHIRAIGQLVVLMAHGQVCAAEPVTTFFRPAADSPVALFLRTGQYLPASPTATPAAVSAAMPRPAEPLAPPTDWGDVASPAPSDFLESREPTAPLAPRPGLPVLPAPMRWVEPGRLGCLLLPAGQRLLDSTLTTLRQLGVGTVLTLGLEGPAMAESATLAGLQLRAAADAGTVHSTAGLAQLIGQVAEGLDHGQVVCVLAQEGAGLAALMAAGWLVRQGTSVASALHQTQALEATFRYTAQEEWQLIKLEAALKRQGGRAPEPVR